MAVVGLMSCLASLAPPPPFRLGPMRSMRLAIIRSVKMTCSFSSSSAKEVTSLTWRGRALYLNRERGGPVKVE